MPSLIIRNVLRSISSRRWRLRKAAEGKSSSEKEVRAVRVLRLELGMWSSCRFLAGNHWDKQPCFLPDRYTFRDIPRKEKAVKEIQEAMGRPTEKSPKPIYRFTRMFQLHYYCNSMCPKVTSNKLHMTFCVTCSTTPTK